MEEAFFLKDIFWVDVRTPGEFLKGSIPGAVNLPLFSNQERHQVGVTYQQDQEEARYYGLRLVAPRLPLLLEEIREQAREKTIILYCFRGGLRSSGIAAVLEMMDFPVLQLEGGYKKFRRYVVKNLLEVLSHLPELVVIYGLTGAGKTDLIRIIRSLNYPALDLEGLAHHRGSAFGRIGIEKQQSQQNFEAHLLFQLKKFGGAPFLIVEAESKNIGQVTLPPLLQERMWWGQKVLLKTPLTQRIERIIIEYAAIGEDFISQAAVSLERLTKRLGPKKVASLQDLLHRRQLEEVVGYLLEEYYDPLYKKSILQKDFLLTLQETDLVSSARKLLQHLEALYC